MITDERIVEVLKNPFREVSAEEIKELRKEIWDMQIRLERLQSMHRAATGRPLHK